MSLLGILLVQQSLVIIGSLAYETTIPGRYGDLSTIPPEKTCRGLSDHLRESPLITFQYRPAPFRSSFTSVSWKKYGKSRPQFVMTVCEFLSISSISFDTINVKSSGIFVDGESYYGAVDQFGKVHVSIDSMNPKFRLEVKITLTPRNYSLPLGIKNLLLETCSIFPDCFEDCAIYILESGCKRPICKENPCDSLDCPEGQECRLIEGEPRDTFPHLMSSGIQLWGCVDKDRTDYGCFCESYGIGEDTCPTCQCGRNSTTNTKVLP